MQNPGLQFSLSTMLCIGLFSSAFVGCTPAEGQERIGETKSASDSRTSLNAVRVQVVPARKATFSGRVSLTGLVKPRRSATVAAEVAGHLVENRCTVGRRVKKGEPVYRVDTSSIRLQVRQASESLAARRTDVAFSVQELARSDSLVARDALPEQVLAQRRYERDRASHSVTAAETALLLAEKRLRDAVVRAPFGGTVARCLVEKGDYVAPGVPVFEIVDLAEARVVVGVPGEIVSKLRVDMTATAELDDLGETRAARLIETSPSPNPRSGTYPARFAMENDDGAVLEGMTVGISLNNEPREVLAVPGEAVFQVSGEPHLFTVRDGRAKERTVRIGDAEDGLVEILGGIVAGERVVVDGMFALTDGRPVMAELSGEGE